MSGLPPTTRRRRKAQIRPPHMRRAPVARPICSFPVLGTIGEEETENGSTKELSSPRLMPLTDYDLCNYKIMNTEANIAKTQQKLWKATDIVHPTLIGVVDPTILQKRFDKLWRLTWHTAEDIENRNRAKASRAKLEEELEKLEEQLKKLEKELLKLLYTS